jgi:hypothetical protein
MAELKRKRILRLGAGGLVVCGICCLPLIAPVIVGAGLVAVGLWGAGIVAFVGAAYLVCRRHQKNCSCDGAAICRCHMVKS